MTLGAPDRQGHLQYGRDKIWWEYFGSGTEATVCLLNGLSMDTRIWYPFADPIRAQALDLLIFDFQGQGQSSVPGEGYRIDTACHQLTAILDSLEIPAVDLAGLSYGAFVGLEYARLYPDRTRSLLLTGAAVTGNRELEVFQDLSNRLFALGIPGLEVYAHHALRKAYGPEFLRQNSAFMAELMPRHFLDTYKDRISSLEYLTASLDRLLSELTADPDRYSAMETPSLVLAGTDDLLTPPAAQRQTSESFLDARFLEWPGAGHLAWFERPADFVRTLGQFIRSSTETFPAPAYENAALAVAGSGPPTPKSQY
jgi:pimeloyl-ACP methyl ester carboxylesterase